MNKNFSKVLALFLAVIMSLPLACFASLGAFAEEETDTTTPTVPSYTEPTVSSEAVAYWAYTGADTNDGLTPATAKKTFGSLWRSILKENGGTLVITGKGFISDSLTVSSGGGPLLITGKDVDGTLYYDPVNPDVNGTTGQTGMIMIAAQKTLVFKSDVIFDNTAILQRSCTSPANVAAIKISNNATMVIGENTLFLTSSDAVANTKLIVDAGSNLVVKAAGALAYEGTGNIFIDKNLVGNGIDASQFANFEGKVYDLDGNSACDIVGHTYKLHLINHEYRNVCTACGDNVLYSYTLPTLTNTTDVVYWANGSTGDGSSVESPKQGGVAVGEVLTSGGTVYLVGKGYIGATASVNYSGTTKITSVLPDGTDYRGVDYTGAAHAEDGSIFAPGGATITFADSIIFEKTAIFSRSTTAPIYKFSNNAVIYCDEVNFGKTTGNYPAIMIDKGTTFVVNENCTGAISAVTGEGTLIIDMKAVQSGLVTGKAVENFQGTIMTTDCKEVCAFTGSHNYVNGTCDICGTVEGTATTKIYVAADGTGDGLTPDNPTYSIRRGFEYASADPIEIILVDDVKISSGIACQAQSQNVTITSMDLDGDGVYPKLVIQSYIVFYNEGSGNTITFENIEIQSDRSGTVPFFMNYNNLVIGDNVTCTLSGNYTTTETGIGYYPTIYGGFLESSGENTVDAKTNHYDSSITVNSGTWRMILGGSRRNASDYVMGHNYGDVAININGGTIIGNETNNVAIAGTGENFYSGTIDINITGGVIQNDIYGVYDVGQYGGATEFGAYGLKGDITIDISGGNIAGDIYAKAENIRIPALIRGNVDVTLGADVILDDVITVDLRGTVPYAGQTNLSTATIDENLLESVTCKFVDEVNGEVTNAGEPKRIAFIGDSITQGTGSVDYKKFSYPAQLQAMLNADEYMVGNFGVGASGVLPSTRYYYNATLQYKLITEEYDPHIVSFALGTNDALSAGGVWGVAVDFETRYHDMIKGIADLDTVEKVYVATPLLRLDTPSRAARNASIIEPAIRSIVADLQADGYDATLFELNANTYEAVVNGSVLGSDQLHPNADGYSVMAQAFYDAIFNGVVDVPDGFYVDTFYVSDNGTETGAGTEEDPSNIYYLGLSRLNKNGGKLVVLDTYTVAGDVVTPVDMTGLTIEGATAESVFTFGGNTFKLGCDTVIDNITFNTTANNPYLVGWYNDVTIGENFTYAAAEGKSDLGFVAGYFIYEDVSTASSGSTTYDTVESASSDKDVTITIKNGTWSLIVLGNRRLSDKGPVGTYSGNMNVQLLGGKISGNSIENLAKTAILGMNYLTGAIDVTVDGMAVDAQCYIVSRTATLTGIVYDSANNTGSIKLTGKASVLDNFAANERPNADDKQHAEIADVTVTCTTAAGDIDEDAAFTNADITLAVRYLAGFAVDGASYSADVNGDGKINNRDAIALIQKVSA